MRQRHLTMNSMWQQFSTGITAAQNRWALLVKTQFSIAIVRASTLVR